MTLAEKFMIRWKGEADPKQVKAIDAYDVALFGAEILMARYPNALMTRYKLDAVPESPSAMLEAIGRKRGRLRAGGVVDLGAAATDLIHAFRTGALGPMSLESPP